MSSLVTQIASAMSDYSGYHERWAHDASNQIETRPDKITQPTIFCFPSTFSISPLRHHVHRVSQTTNSHMTTFTSLFVSSRISPLTTPPSPSPSLPSIRTVPQSSATSSTDRYDAMIVTADAAFKAGKWDDAAEAYTVALEIL